MISVLIIDDDVELCAMLRDYLEPNGIQLSIMHHGVSGSELLRREDFALLILDVMLPEVDGFDVLRSLRN
jgi:two-component system response regulator CpxR